MINIISERVKLSNNPTHINLSDFQIKSDELIVDFNNQSIYEQLLSVSAIVLYLSDKQSVMSIDLSNNDIFDNSIQIITNIIKNYDKLKVVKISNCKIGDYGILYFLKNLLLHESLKQVNISNNPGSSYDIVGEAVISIRTLQPELSDIDLDNLEAKIIY